MRFVLLIAVTFLLVFNLSADESCYYYGSELHCVKVKNSTLKGVDNWPVIIIRHDIELPLTGEIGVAFKNNVSDIEIAQIVKKYELKIARTVAGLNYLKIFKAKQGTDLFKISKAIYESGNAKWAQPMWLESPSLLSTPDDSYYVDQWHHGVINSEKAWDYAIGYQNAKIAVLDSGVDTFHPDLVLQLGMSFVPSESDVNPNMGGFQNQYIMAHGTCVSGLAAAQGFNGAGITGVCPRCSIIPIKYIGLEQDHPPLDRKLNAVKWAVDEGAWVINNSWTIAPDKNTQTNECLSIPADNFVKELIDYAALNGRGGLGTVIVWAAGNSTCDTALNPSLNDDRIVVVSALDIDDSLVHYSNYGVNVNIAAPAGDAVIGKGGLVTTDVSTPGKGFNPAFNNADPSYADFPDQFFTKYFDGTSAASPVVAGAIALMLSLKPEMTLSDAISCMTKAATTPQKDCQHGDKLNCYGAGILNVGKMVEMAYSGECGGSDKFYCFEDWQCDDGEVCNVDSGVCGISSEVPDETFDEGQETPDNSFLDENEAHDDEIIDSPDEEVESKDEIEISDNSNKNEVISESSSKGCSALIF